MMSPFVMKWVTIPSVRSTRFSPSCCYNMCVCRKNENDDDGEEIFSVLKGSARYKKKRQVTCKAQ